MCLNNECIDKNIAYPCTSDCESIITCDGTQYFNTTEVATKIINWMRKRKKQQNFEELNFYNKNLTKLDENAFSLLAFKKIKINEAENLEEIHQYAFKSSSNISTELEITVSFIYFIDISCLRKNIENTVLVSHYIFHTRFYFSRKFS